MRAMRPVGRRRARWASQGAQCGDGCRSMRSRLQRPSCGPSVRRTQRRESPYGRRRLRPMWAPPAGVHPVCIFQFAPTPIASPLSASCPGDLGLRIESATSEGWAWTVSNRRHLPCKFDLVSGCAQWRCLSPAVRRPPLNAGSCCCLLSLVSTLDVRSGYVAPSFGCPFVQSQYDLMVVARMPDHLACD